MCISWSVDNPIIYFCVLTVGDKNTVTKDYKTPLEHNLFVMTMWKKEILNESFI